MDPFERATCDACKRQMDMRPYEREESLLPNGWRYVNVSGWVGFFLACCGECASTIREMFKVVHEENDSDSGSSDA